MGKKERALGWAAKSSAWEEPNAHFPFEAWCPDNTDGMKVLQFSITDMWHCSLFKLKLHLPTGSF